MKNNLGSHKKASTPVYGLEYIVTPVIVVIVLAGLISLINTYMGIKLDSRGVENSILIKRITYEPGLLVYEDNETGRRYPGIIDMSKFDAERLNDVFLNNNKRLAAVLELKNLKTEEIKKVYINEKRARAWEDIVPIGDFDTSSSRRYVRIFNAGEFEPGLLKIKVIIKK